MAKQAALLIRVSTDLQEYERQVNDLSALAISHGYEVQNHNIFKEKESGYSPIEQRLELTRLLQNIHNKQTDIEIIFVAEISRVARSPKIAREIIEEAIELKIPFYIVGIGRTLNEDGERNPTNSVIIQMFSEFAHQEILTMKSRIKSGKRQGAANGNVVGSIPNFGYTTIGEGKGLNKLIIHDEEAKVVREIYQMFLAGIGSNVVYKHLNRQGIKTKLGKKWQNSTICQLVRNPIYKGYRRYKGELLNVIPPIIPEDTWNKVNDLMDKRSTYQGKNKKYLYLLQNRVYCGVCGLLYSGRYVESKQGISKNSFYQCLSKKYEPNCKNNGIGIEPLESLVWHVVRNKQETYNHLKNTNGELFNVKKDIDTLELYLNDFISQIGDKQLQKERILNLYVKGKYSESQMDHETSQLDKQLKNLQFKIGELKETIKVKKAWEFKFENLDSYIEVVKGIEDDRKKINEVLPNILNRVIINAMPNLGKNIFLITVFLFGQKKSISCLYNKRKYSVLFNNLIDVEYDSNNVVKSDLKAITDQFITRIGSKVKRKNKPFKFENNSYEERVKKIMFDKELKEIFEGA